MAVTLGSLKCMRRFGVVLTGMLLVGALVSTVSAQTQASCQFITTFGLQQSSSNGGYNLVPRGVNDYASVVGFANNDVDNSSWGFVRFAGGSFSYKQYNSVNTVFEGRNNSGVDIGDALSASGTPTPFTFQGSTFKPLTMTIGNTTYRNFYPHGINRWGTIVGLYYDSAGAPHGFKRFSNGTAIALNYPGAAETSANAINDNGVIVGWYSKQPPPHRWQHGFIYHNGQWATVSYPNSSLETTLDGISNANQILGNTSQNTTGQFSFIYERGAFKKIIMPNSSLPTFADGMSAGKGLITGFSGMEGFIATCK